MDNTEAQNLEITALKSIYLDTKSFIVDRMDPPCGRYSAEVQLSDPPDRDRVLRITLKNNTLCSREPDLDCSRSEYEEFQVNYLPPINLYFEYPENYPSDSPPAFLLSCCWLSYEQLSKLCKHLDVLWHRANGQVILYEWFQFLKEETLSFLNIEDCLDITELSKYKLKVGNKNVVPLNVQPFGDKCVISSSNTDNNPEQKIKYESGTCSKTVMPAVKPSISGGSSEKDCRAFLDIADGKVLKNLLKDYDEFKKSECFSVSMQVCNICFSERQGSEFVTFRVCRHFFCKDCVKSYFELLIKEGSVYSLNCLHDKCTTQADGSMVKQIVNKDSFERYDSLLLERTLGTMNDVVYCPRKACQTASMILEGDRIALCSKCQFVYCPFCKMAYHGIAPCNFNPKLKQQICDTYIKGDSNTKAEFENRYGKRTIKTLVEEVLSEKWIGSNSKNCPHCKASIEKTEGCNKMTCFRCGSYFCWLCTKQLKASNPYAHYSDRSSECFDKLFPEDYMDDDMFEPGEFLNF